MTSLYEPYVLGGAERFTQVLADALQARGHEVAVLTGALQPSLWRMGLAERQPGIWEFRPANVYPYVVKDHDGVRRARPPLTGLRPVHFALDAVAARPAHALRSFASFWRPDVINTHNLRGLGLRVLPEAAATAPLVHTIHDGALICLTGVLRHADGRVCRGDRWPCRALRPRFRQLTAHTAAGVVAPSQFYAEIYRTGGLFAGAWQRVIRQPAETCQLSAEELKKERLDAQSRLERTGRVRALFLGQVADHKGVHGLVRAAVGSECAEVRIAGKVTDGEATALRKMGAVVLGPVSGKAKWREIAAANTICLPSVCAENAPQAVEEAFSAGVPVIASSVGGIPERVQHQFNGLLVPPRDEAELGVALRSLREGDRYRILSSGAANSASAVDIAAEYLAAYQAACGTERLRQKLEDSAVGADRAAAPTVAG